MKALLCIICLSCVSLLSAQESIDNLLTQWHKAAEEANFDAYFSYFAENAHFIGTDASENWNVKEFKRYAKSSFESAPAWKFVPIERNIEMSQNEQFAWFDEILTSDHLGVCRGSGVLVIEQGEWKIVHYVLSLIIPNALAREVAEFKKKADAESVNGIIKTNK